MSGTTGLQIAVVGATGSLGGEVLAVLDERRFPVAGLLPFATDRSLGTEVEFRGRAHPVETRGECLGGADLAFLCAPPDASLEFARAALRARVPALDLSGALADQPDVPLLLADLKSPAADLTRPLVAAPAGPALAWALVLDPIARTAGLHRVVGTVLESASGAGRLGVESLSVESIALFNQAQPSGPPALGRPIAFDCLPAIGEVGEGGATSREHAFVSALGRLLGEAAKLAVTAIRVPTFSGDASCLMIETARPLSAKEACALWDKAPGVEVWRQEAEGPTSRTSAGRDVALVGRVRPDPSAERGLLLWIAADTVRLAAFNAVRLAEARFDAA